jgi:hypothetical protein
MLFGLLLTLGVAVLSVGLRTFHNSYTQKAGALGILAATFLGFYFATNNWVWGLVAALAWLSALAGNSHPDPCITTSKRKTASTEKSAIVRHVPGA